MKMSGEQGPDGGALMPLATGAPIPDASVIWDWIAAGAPTQCVSDVGPTSDPDPNALDQNALFTCPSGAPLASSPARLRRIDHDEWAYAISSADGPTWFGSTTYLNPFVNASGVQYDTYSRRVTVDTATLDLYFVNLPDATQAWDRADPAGNSGPRIFPSYDNAKMKCIFTEAAPDDACIDAYVDAFLPLASFRANPLQTWRKRTASPVRKTRIVRCRGSDLRTGDPAPCSACVAIR
jgi:hypothetical protein